MAVYTDITDDELAAFLGDYGLGQAVAFKGIAEGVENSNFLVRTETGTFVLTVTSDPLPVGAERARELARR